jgi:hypothetical protein
MTKAERDAMVRRAEGLPISISVAWIIHGLNAECERLEKDLARLSEENAVLRKQIEGHCDRIAKQSELLSKRAEKPNG